MALWIKINAFFQSIVSPPSESNDKETGQAIETSVLSSTTAKTTFSHPNNFGAKGEMESFGPQVDIYILYFLYNLKYDILKSDKSILAFQ